MPLKVVAYWNPGKETVATSEFLKRVGRQGES